MAVKSNFASGDVLTASDVNTYLTNGGLVYITQTLVTSGSTTTVDVNSCFSSTYSNYRLVIDSFQPSVASRALCIKLKSGSTVTTGSDYYYYGVGGYVDGTTNTMSGNGAAFMETGMFNSATNLALGSAQVDIINPFKTERTFFNFTSVFYNANYGSRTGGGAHNLTTSYDGMQFCLSSTGNITTMRVRVYGYREA